MSEEQLLRKRYYAAQFAVWELHLFLDTHPNNKEAARRLEEHQGRAAQLKREFEEKYGPIGEMGPNTSRWAWVSDPWPWEKEGN
ncbi:MAG TPA: spore coat protein CotJB [Candidatus Acutalibacter stercorigallinarum]|nr:spore coat protein CotJB [Candidatus Acutalibacter stercorigallinarum]